MKVGLLVFLFLITPILVILIYQKYRFAKKIGTVILAYAVGVITALFLTFTDFLTDNQTVSLINIENLIMKISIPLAIPLMLFNSDFKLWTKSLPKTVAALFTGLVAVVIAMISGFYIFRNSGIEDFPGVAAMLTGIYTGGTMNFTALGGALKVDPNIITITLTFQMLVIFPFVLFVTGGGYRFFRWILPFKDPAASLDDQSAVKMETVAFERYDRMLHKWVFPRLMLAFGIAILIVGIGVGLAILTTGRMNELVIILTITTLAIAASFSKRIRNLPKTFELGMFFILLFCVSAAAQFDISKIDTSVMSLLYFIITITVISITVHLILCRIFKVTGDLFTVAIMGLFCSPPFIPPAVSAMGNKKVLISGVAIGLVGYAIGTYLGVILYYLFQIL
ncbi:MAG: hypothetical protein CVU04_01800 [Bacteroidetes bacterium HGW-Bacteroidetes-20]|nr:MAG: hypothetical protein CVU04_01800 [Bacteroidetes bacterium HGW-Bacteroidetes-20]